MNIRRYVANDMREALAAIRTDLGAEAVMLSSRKLPNGVEVIAAIDYDDSLFSGSDVETADAASTAQLNDYERAARSIETAAPLTTAPAAPAAPVAFAAAAAASTAVPAPAVATAADSGAESSVALEIKDLRRLLETQLASLAWSDLNRQAPVRARLLRELAKLGVDSTVAAELADEAAPAASSQEAMRVIVRRFGERLPLVTWDMAEDGGVFAIVGPTGVGKTTSIAKIAARFVLRHGVDQLGLVSTDTYRIGARQQLNNFARILRAPMHVAENAADLRRILDGFESKKLVLIDRRV